MKVRWTNDSLRLRITPAELASIGCGDNVSLAITFPGGGSWSIVIVTKTDASTLVYEQNSVRIYLSRTDIEKLNAPDAEGIYFTTPGESVLKYMIEKDFPCAHPRPAQAMEVPTETFAPPLGFEERKQNIRGSTNV